MEFLIGFLGAITGGVFLALALYLLYQYEASQKDKLAEKFMKEFKTALATGKDQYSKSKVTTLYPDSDKIN